jgi:hypothetical protein
MTHMTLIRDFFRSLFEAKLLAVCALTLVIMVCACVLPNGDIVVVA